MSNPWYHRSYHKKHREKRNKAQRERSRKARRLVVEHYGGSPPKCSCCGTDIYEFLTIGHKEGLGALHRKIVGRGEGVWKDLIRKGFPEGIVILCWNCNAAEQYYGVCPHEERKKCRQEIDSMIHQLCAFSQRTSLLKTESEKTTETSTNLPIQ